MKISIEIKGAKEFTRRIKKMGGDAPHIAGASLYQSAEAVMTRSREEFCPIKTGALKSTGHVQHPQINGADVTVALGYGGPAAPYAVVVHETNKHYNFDKQWKYLETPLKEALPAIQQKLKEDLDTEFGKT
jgi:hypothetical protein